MGPTIRLALARADNRTMEDLSVVAKERPGKLHMLVSYAYKNQHERAAQIPYADLMLDSGAFSAFWSGTKIDMADYVSYCREGLKNDPRLVEVIQLDVIGDWKAGRANLERMWSEGIPALPVFHFGEPWEHLYWLKEKWPYKICVGGAVGVQKQLKLRQIAEVLRRVWPMRVHALGIATERAVECGPLDSMDATNWNSTKRFGVYPSLGGAKLLGVKGATSRSSIRYFLDIQERGRDRWKGVWSKIEKDLPPWPLKEFPCSQP